MKKGKMIGITLVTASLLTGCIDRMPDMTEEQSALIAEYAADMLLKYSPNYTYKIADKEELVEEATIEEATEEVSEEAATEEQTSQQLPEETKQDPEASTETGEQNASGDIADAGHVDYAEVFAIEDVEIRYDSKEICSVYPAGEIGTGFSVNAKDGNCLIVMHFSVKNTSQADITCDLFEKDFDISMRLNSGNYKKVSSTLLVNDFTTYIEEIPAGETKEAVIVAETEKITEEEIESFMLRISNDDTSITVNLKK